MTGMTNKEQVLILEKWLNQYRGLMFKFVRAYAFTPEDRDDLFQEIILHVWRSIRGFKGDSSPSTWIYRVALNISITWNRKENKHREVKEEFKNSQTLLKPVEMNDPRLDWIYEQLTGFNEIDRAITLLMLDGFSYKEMSEMLGISETNVGVKINRIKKKLIEKSKELNERNHGI